MLEYCCQMLSSIYRYRWISQTLVTGGQPTREQFASVREAGVEVVINLALPTSDNALPDEGALVTGLGMVYVQIPVNFEGPTTRDFEAFCGVMRGFEGRRKLVHCAANMRVSAFIYLYRVLCEGVSKSVAEEDLLAIWKPEGVWEKFVDEQLRRGGRNE